MRKYVWGGLASLVVVLSASAQSIRSYMQPINDALPKISAISNASNSATATSNVSQTLINIGPCDGVTDLTQTLNSALASLPASGGKIHFQAGKCYFSGAVTFNYPTTVPFSVSITGEGQDATRLYFATGGANFLTLNMASPRHSFHVEELTFSCGIAGCGTALTVNNSQQEGNFAQNDLRKVTFSGEDGGQGIQYWNNGFYEKAVSNINIDGCLFYGDSSDNKHTGINISGDPAGGYKYTLVVNVTNSGFFNNRIGIALGDYWQGVQISNSNFTNGTNAIVQRAEVSHDAVLSQLSISNSQFNTHGNLIGLNSGIDQVSLSNNLFYVYANSTGVLCNVGCLGVTAVGNNFTHDGGIKNGQNGIVIDNTANHQPSVVSSNTFQGQVTAVWLKSGATNTTVSTNTYTDNIANVTNNGGIYCPASNSGNCVGVATP